MPPFFAPLSPEYTINIPTDPVAIAVWVILLGLIFLFVFRIKDKDLILNRQTLIWMAVLSILVLVLTPFLGINVNIEPESSIGLNPSIHLMFFAAVPWILAGGMVGVVPASLLAGMSGLLFAYLETHQIFSPLVFMSIASFFSWGVRQRYRTSFFKLLRIPIFSAIFSFIVVTPILFISELIILSEPLPIGIAITLGRMPVILIAYGGMVLVAGVVAVIVQAIFRENWGRQKPLEHAPGEKNLYNRLMIILLPLVLSLLVIIFGFIWKSNVDSARRELVVTLVNTSDTIAEAWKMTVDSGVIAMGDAEKRTKLSGLSNPNLSQILSKYLEEVSFFNQLTILKSDGEIISSAVEGNEAPDAATEEILTAVENLPGGVVKIIPAHDEDFNNEFLNFLKRIPQEGDQSPPVIWGQLNLVDNHVSSAVISALDLLEKQNGDGWIINTKGMRIFGTQGRLLFEQTLIQNLTRPTYIETRSAEGEFQFQYFHPIKDTDWAVVTAVPASVVYEAAWRISWPILVVGLCMIALVLLVVYLIFSPISKDITTITDQIKQMADGHLNYDTSDVKTKGELSLLFDRFHALGVFLSGRLTKQSDLLMLNEELSISDDFLDSMQTIMRAGINRNANFIRVILNENSNSIKTLAGKRRLSLGAQAETYSFLDDDIHKLVGSKGEFVIRDFEINQMINPQSQVKIPPMIIGMPMNWQGVDLGVFWAAFFQDKSLTEDDIDFFRSLSRNASMETARAKSFTEALKMKIHMESVLDVLSDGILLLNGSNHVIYCNHSIRLLLNLSGEDPVQQQLSSLISDPVIADFILKADTNAEPVVYKTTDGKIFGVYVSFVDLADGQIGKTVIFKDISKATEQELKKTEFVMTASHELRSPLALIHGYAKLLRLTGNLNDQQETYLDNIIEAVDEMKILVQNLLDVGRLESGQSLEIKRISALELAKDVYQDMQTFAKQKNISLEIQLPDAPLEIDADEIFLAQAMKNLIENAIKFTKIGGNVVLSVRKTGDNVVFVVEDNGIGIAPLDQRYLFEKFKHGPTLLGRDSKGKGLGLAIVKSIAERHGGRVWFESQLARGSKFYLEIPQDHIKSR